MKKITLSYGGEAQDILFDAVENTFYGYEEHQNEVHNRYGGKAFYESRSGCTGEGYIDDPITDQIFMFGWYRTDKPLQRGELIGDVYVFYPQANHVFHDGGYPVVLSRKERDEEFFSTDGGEWRIEYTVLYSDIHEVSSSMIASFHSVKKNDHFRELEIQVYTPELKRVKIKIQFCQNWFYGLDVLRFVRDSIEQTFGNVDEYIKDYNSSRLLQVMGIKKHIEEKMVLTKFGIITKVFENMDEVEEEMKKYGWHRESHTWWKRKADKIYLITEMPRGKYMDDYLPEFVEYETEISAIQFFAEKEKYIQDNQWHCLRKLRKDWASLKRQQLKTETKLQDVMRILRENPDKTLSVQDSIDAGNCEPGTNTFIKKYFPNVEGSEITYGELIEHPQLNGMLMVFDFRKLIAPPLSNDEEEEEGEEEY